MNINNFTLEKHNVFIDDNNEIITLINLDYEFACLIIDFLLKYIIESKIFIIKIMFIIMVLVNL